MANREENLDMILVGAGLQNGLIALLCRLLAPERRVLVLERDEEPLGNHTWCFHADDLPQELEALREALVEVSWPAYRVAFQSVERHLDCAYSMLSSEHLRKVLREVEARSEGALELRCSTPVEQIDGQSVRLASGETLHAKVVIDARGPGGLPPREAQGYQKFVGLEIECADGHGVEEPLLMDARVEQLEGFRFFYLLPLSRERLLIEDTRYSDDHSLDVAAMTQAVHEYAAALGLEGYRVVRREKGVLPLPLTPSASSDAEILPMRAGYQGGWFHPVTGYSFPAAMRVAHFIASTSLDELVESGLRSIEGSHRRQLRFFYRLNRMLFRWFPPKERHNVLARFYTLPEASIGRFYAMQMTDLDRARVFLGRPPKGLSYRDVFTGRKAQ